MRFGSKILAALWLLGALTLLADFQGSTHLVPFDEETIQYSKSKPTGRVAQLQQQIAEGKITLKKDRNHGYLPALLEHFKIAPSSQVLVFSKTSFQRDRISPRTPRALYFNDDVYIGYIPGSPLLEITEVDPKLGAVFYTFDQHESPKFVRNDQCLECHASAKSMGVPGHVVRSFMTDKEGVVDLTSGTSTVNHRTPFEERWGGWYVTGTHGQQTHRGNLIGKEDFAKQQRTISFGGNLTNLASFFNVKDYVEGGSDIVALMVLEHQTHLHNFITRYHFESRIALQQYGHLRYLNSITDSFVKYLLLVEEAPLHATIKGTSNFANDFEKQGPKDSKGRSLREFDLTSRLFKYPCSYLIYSDAFEALPPQAKERIYNRLFEVLSGKDKTEAYSKVTPAMRQTILEILIATKKDLPPNWTPKPA